jgi:predicted patatin/cPLA2 family phospholipase
MHRDKTAIVISWWWMWSSYWVWCILAMIEMYWSIRPDIIIAGSGSTGTMSYFVSWQYDAIQNIWLHLLSTSKFINPFRFRKIMDIDYLIDDVFQRQEPLDAEKIYNSEIDYYLSVTNGETWKVEYLSNHSQIDIFEAMRASKAIPILYGKKVLISWKQYLDTPNSTSIELKIQKAIELWAKKIVIIDNWKKTRKWITAILLLWKSGIFKKNYRKEYTQRIAYQTPKDVRTVLLRPQWEIEIWLLQNDEEMIRKTIERWYNETLSNKDIRSFLTW